jgi:eukaryotic-like serine/threonine-protein kinase
MSEIFSRLPTAVADRYTIERELGAGGMATVYLAQDLKHHRKVALKVLRPEIAAVLGAERFVQEIKTTASLQHPNILPLFDSGEADGFLYYVMPYIEGETLRDRLNREAQLSIEESVQIASDLAEALEAAHEQGVIHRDIKPENVLLHKGRAMVADFGIALAVSAAASGRLTETGLSLGTPHYMSPEQATADRELNNRSDIYSLGAVLYEMLTGDPPHTGATAQQIVSRIVTEGAPPVADRRKSTPPNVAAATMKALEKLPADRFATAADFAHALSDPSFRVAAASTHGTSRSLWNPLSVVSTAAAGVLLAYVVLSRDGARGIEPAVSRYAMSLSGVPAVPVEFGGELKISPDGATIAYIGRTAQNERRVYVKEPDQIAARVVGSLGTVWQPIFSPDGAHLAGTAAGEDGLAITSLATGETRFVTDSGVWAGDGDWSADGWLYVQSDRGTIVRYQDGSGEVQDMTTLGEDELEHLFPEVLPGGRGMLFTVWRTSPEFEGARIAVTEIGSGSHRVITLGNRALYSTTGHLLVLRSDGSVHAAPFDTQHLEMTGPLVRLFDGVAIGPYAGFDFDISESGDLVYAGLGAAQSAMRELVWVDRTGATRPVDPTWLAEFESVAVSPEGDRIAVTIGSQAPTTIWLKSLDNRPPSRFTFAEGLNRRPVWSREGDTLYFISDRDGPRALYAKPADGTGTIVPVLTLAQQVDQVSEISADGWLVYRTGVSEGERDIYARLVGSDSVTVQVAAAAEIDEHSPALSPDGRFVAYVSDESGRSEVWVRPFPGVPGGRWLVSSDGGEEPVWSHDGKELFYRTGSQMVAAAVRADPTFAVVGLDTLFSSRQLYSFGVHAAYDVSRDGRRFLMIRTRSTDVHEVIVVRNFVEELKRLAPATDRP